MVDKKKLETNPRKITRKEVLMGRDVANPLTPEMETNLETLLIAVNLIRDLYGKPMTVSSGYRPAAANAAAGGAKRSAHLTCEAVDFADPDRKLMQWLLRNLDILEKAGLYLESPIGTPHWCHLQTRPPKSGKRVFIP